MMPGRRAGAVATDFGNEIAGARLACINQIVKSKIGQALAGIRIIDMTHNQAGPACAPDPGVSRRRCNQAGRAQGRGHRTPKHARPSG